MNYALLEYLAEKNANPAWAAGESAPVQKSTLPPVPLSDRILSWWLKRSRWRLVRLRA
ncbi:MAG: hypothetical protein ACI8RZ_003946 [Myxococcota bacterium]|jgi:hypothetical protein